MSERSERILYPLGVRVLPRRFYLPSAAEVAPRLLGAVIVSKTGGQRVAGRIVEVEAYIQNDEACHANRGETRRNASMFGPPGRAYVYRIHRSFCLNLVTCPAGVAEAVLIRAVEPVAGEDVMRRRRRGATGRLLAGGPGRVCQALGLDLAHDGISLAGPLLRVVPGTPPARIQTTPRIGISKNTDAPLRFVDPDSPCLSRP